MIYEYYIFISFILCDIFKKFVERNGHKSEISPQLPPDLKQPYFGNIIWYKKFTKKTIDISPY